MRGALRQTATPVGGWPAPHSPVWVSAAGAGRLRSEWCVIRCRWRGVSVSLPERTDVAASEWDARLAAVFADPSMLRLVYQPIVDLQRGTVAGYETLARFTTPDGRPSEATPDRWFAAADAVGRGAELESIVVRQALAVLPTLPADCFLTVSVSPHLLTPPELAEPLLAVDDLAPLVLELTEHHAVGDLRPLIDLRDRLRAKGALLALDDAGSGYSGLQQITQFRPQLIKLDRALVSGVDGDEVKLALVEMLGEFGGGNDDWEAPGWMRKGGGVRG